MRRPMRQRIPETAPGPSAGSVAVPVSLAKREYSEYLIAPSLAEILRQVV